MKQKVSIAGVFRCCVDNAFYHIENYGNDGTTRLQCPYCKSWMKLEGDTWVNTLDEPEDAKQKSV